MKMGKEWADLSPDEKREERFKQWLSPLDVKSSSAEAGKGYKERATRFIKAIKLEEPDRVPVILPAAFFPAYHAGITLQTAIYDYDELGRAWLRFLRDFDMDTFFGTACIAGNVPVSMLCTGTPQAIKEYCRRLIEVAGKGGGYILTGGANMDEGNPDNLRAMMAAATEYGVYK
jgi:uroporphyrinogen-III decarboxylase